MGEVGAVNAQQGDTCSGRPNTCAHTHTHTHAEGNEHGTRDKHTVNRRQRGGQRDSVHRRESSYWFNNESIYQLVNCCNIDYKPL